MLCLLVVSQRAPGLQVCETRPTQVFCILAVSHEPLHAATYMSLLRFRAEHVPLFADLFIHWKPPHPEVLKG